MAKKQGSLKSRLMSTDNQRKRYPIEIAGEEFELVAPTLADRRKIAENVPPMMKLKRGKEIGSSNMDDYDIVYDMSDRNVWALCLLAREPGTNTPVFNTTSDPRLLLDYPVGSWVDEAAARAGDILAGSEGNAEGTAAS